MGHEDMHTDYCVILLKERLDEEKKKRVELEKKLEENTIWLLSKIHDSKLVNP